MENAPLERKVKHLTIAVIVLAILLAAAVAATVILARNLSFTPVTTNETETLPVVVITAEPQPSDPSGEPASAEPDLSGITYSFGPSSGIPDGARIGAGGTGHHPVGVFLDGEPLTGIGAVSADESVCIVEFTEDNAIHIQNIAPGTADITVTQDGEIIGFFTWVIGN